MEEVKKEEYNLAKVVDEIKRKYNRLKRELFAEYHFHAQRGSKMDLNKLFKKFEIVYRLEWDEIHSKLNVSGEFPIGWSFYKDKVTLMEVYREFFDFASGYFH